MTSQQSITLGLADLARFERGVAEFAIGVDGELEYQGTEATVQILDGEAIDDFLLRVRRDHDLQCGDRLALLNNGKRVDTVRVRKQPRHAA